MATIKEQIKKAVEHEREECAKIVDKYKCVLGRSAHEDAQAMYTSIIAREIRERGKQ